MADPGQIEQSDELHERIARLIGAAGRLPLEGFLALARTAHGGSSVDAPGSEALGLRALQAELDRFGTDLARYQARYVPAVRQRWATAGTNLASIDELAELAPLPAELFRLRRIAAHPPELDARRFCTSGTSQGPQARGAHPFRLTRTTELAALTWAERMLWPDAQPRSLVLLCADERSVPDSSLSFMLARFAERLAPDATSWHVEGSRLDIDAVADACARARARGEPALVAGTAFAFAELLERAPSASFTLPARSRLMPTGGFKGRRRELDASELRERLADRFAVPTTHVVGEYGMTELSSQLYEGTLVRALGLGCPDAEPGCFYAPPWLGARAIDPISLSPLPVGEVGLCHFIDLSNVDSSLTLLTADLVRARADGAIELLGRRSDAPPRGCSLGLEELLAGS